MSNIVTLSQADTVLEVNRANAIKQAVSKVKAKKPLTKAEVELLQTIAYSAEQGGAPSITETSTIVDLAAALVDAETLQYELWGECKQPRECQVVVHEPHSFNRGGITVTFGNQKTHNGANMAIEIAL